MSEGVQLVARGISKQFGDHQVLDQVELVCPAGSLTALVGPNGAGKSTLLRCLAGATELDAGVIELDGQPTDTTEPHYWQTVLSILDDHAWLPHLTIRDHLLAVADDDQAEMALDRVGLTGLGDRRSESLSSGQRQRAALAITLVRPWQVLLLDEPERHLDSNGLALLVDLFAGWADRTVVFATHDAALLASTNATAFDVA